MDMTDLNSDSSTQQPTNRMINRSSLISARVEVKAAEVFEH